MKSTSSSHWKDQSDEHDYSASANYLSLLADPEQAKKIAASFKKAAISKYLANALLRASRLPLLPSDNFHVKADLKKVKKGDLLAPILLLRGELKGGRPLIIADGYHRVCASYYLDENTEVICRIVDL